MCVSNLTILAKNIHSTIRNQWNSIDYKSVISIKRIDQSLPTFMNHTQANNSFFYVYSRDYLSKALSHSLTYSQLVIHSLSVSLNSFALSSSLTFSRSLRRSLFRTLFTAHSFLLFPALFTVHSFLLFPALFIVHSFLLFIAYSVPPSLTLVHSLAHYIAHSFALSLSRPSILSHSFYIFRAHMEPLHSRVPRSFIQMGTNASRSPE